MVHNDPIVRLVGLTDSAWDYLESCARIRNISCPRLIQRIVRVIGEEQMVLSVLDDNSSAEHRLESGEHVRSHASHIPLWDSQKDKIARRNFK